MKKGNAILVFAVLIFFTAVTWISTVQGRAKDAKLYDEYMEKAEQYEKKEIYIDALANYKKALDIKPKSYDLVLKIADVYYRLGDMDGFISTCNKAISMRPDDPVPYINKVNYFISESEYKEAIKVVNTALKNVKEKDELNELNNVLSEKYTEVYSSFSEVGDWYYQDNTAFMSMKSGNKWGIAFKSGSSKIRAKYEYIGAYDSESGLIPCCYDGDYYYIDINGNKKLVGDYTYQYLGSFGCGCAPAKRNGKYGYINGSFQEKDFKYEYTGAFANNIAAVKKDGKWALINRDFQMVTDFEYDDIILDSYGFCSNYNIIVAKKDDKYIFLDHTGKRIGNQSFDYAALPASNDSYIAVKIGGKWGFVDQNGSIVIEPIYEEAKSFSIGFAPVKKNDEWGYINVKGEMIIEAEYQDAGVFSRNGVAPVKINESTWNFLVMCKYDN